MQFSQNSLLPQNLGGGLSRLDGKMETLAASDALPGLAQPSHVGRRQARAAGLAAGEDLERRQIICLLFSGCVGDVTERPVLGSLLYILIGV